MSYEKELINNFTRAYRISLVKFRRNGARMTEEEFYKYNLRFAKRWDSKWMTKFSDCVCEDVEPGPTATAFDFNGKKLL